MYTTYWSNLRMVVAMTVTGNPSASLSHTCMIDTPSPTTTSAASRKLGTFLLPQIPAVTPKTPTHNKNMTLIISNNNETELTTWYYTTTSWPAISFKLIAFIADFDFSEIDGHNLCSTWSLVLSECSYPEQYLNLVARPDILHWTLMASYVYTI